MWMKPKDALYIIWKALCVACMLNTLFLSCRQLSVFACSQLTFFLLIEVRMSPPHSSAGACSAFECIAIKKLCACILPPLPSCMAVLSPSDLRRSSAEKRRVSTLCLIEPWKENRIRFSSGMTVDTIHDYRRFLLLNRSSLESYHTETSPSAKSDTNAEIILLLDRLGRKSDFAWEVI